MAVMGHQSRKKKRDDEAIENFGGHAGDANRKILLHQLSAVNLLG
jgi:hypothetical protein